MSRLETTSAPSTKTTPLAPRGAQPPHQVHTTPSGGASGVTSDSLTLDRKLLAEARQDRVCPECGSERLYRRVWRHVQDTWADGRILGPGFLSGRLQLVCLGCCPEFVVNPYEAQRS